MPGKPDIEKLVDLHRLWVHPSERCWQYGYLEVGGELRDAVIRGEGQKELRRKARAAWHWEQERGATGDPILILMEAAEPVSKQPVTDWVTLRCLNCGGRLLDIFFRKYSKHSAGGHIIYKDWGDRQRAAARRLRIHGPHPRHRFAPLYPADRIRCFQCNEEADWAFSPMMNWVRYRIIAPGRCLP